MATIHKTAAALRFWGDDLDPPEVTRFMGVAPTSAVSKGELIVGRGPRVARSGRWSLNVNSRQPGDLSGQIEEVLSGLTQDLDVWRDLSGRFNGCIFAGLFMAEGNEGHDLSAETLKLLTDRGLSLLLDIYSGHDDDNSGVYPLAMTASSKDGGDRTDRDELASKAQNDAWQFAKGCRDVEEHTPATEGTSLGGIINHLMTELWDNGFSTEEIQDAFASAALDAVQYAGHEARNGSGIRGVALLSNSRDHAQPR